jgi:hypothetical protein
MPMRGELRGPAGRSDDNAAADIGAIIGFCLIGLAISIYLALSVQGLDQIPVLIVQYNWG